MNLSIIENTPKYEKTSTYFTDDTKSGIYMLHSDDFEFVLNTLEGISGVARWDVINSNGKKFIYFPSDTLWVGSQDTVIQNDITKNNQIIFEFFQQRLSENFRQIINSVVEISNRAVYIHNYQFLFDSDNPGGIQLFNFEKSNIDYDVMNVMEHNIQGLASFYKAFSLPFYADILESGIRYLALANRFNETRDLSVGGEYLTEKDRTILSSLYRFSDRSDLTPFQNVYFSYSPRHIMLGAPQVHIPIQSNFNSEREYVFMFTKDVLDKKKIDEWELIPLVETHGHSLRNLSKYVSR